MAKYYYLVSSLPYLTFKKETFITKESFLEECEKWLEEKELEILRRADLNIDSIKTKDCEFLRKWKEYNRTFKEDIAEARKKNGQTGKNTSEEVKLLFEKENPLKKEEFFEKTRWNFIERETSGYNFDINWLVAYYLKIQILERLKTFDKEKGEMFFYELCEVQI